MRIIRPYGRSSTEFDGQEKLTRKLRQSPKYDTSVEIGKFAETHPELVIAQWISAIDKIAAKPYGNKKPTPEQWQFRQRLGKAAFRVLTEKKLIDFSESREKDESTLDKVWWAKIHPYGKGTDKKSSGRTEGRWYKRFAGDMDVSKADVAAIVERIYKHLHEHEYRLDEARPQKRKGRIAARAASIRDNALRPRPAVYFVDSLWTDKDEDDYKDKGDVAGDIARKAAELEKTNHRMSVRKAAEVLYAQYGKLFYENGKVLSIEEARKKSPRLFDLHMAVKDTYVRLLKNHKKKSVAHVLPKDMPALFRLIERKSDNRELNALVRMGKVIHYSAGSKENEDAPRNVIDNWPGDATHSHYWTSDGQAKIKRNEAFVRVWRHTIALAAQTAKDWADPNGKIQKDILFNIKKVTEADFDNAAYQRKLPLLFGNQDDLFTGNDEGFQKSVLRLALEGLAALRNSSFHFKGRGGFVAALKPDLSNANSVAVAAARDLVESDFKGQWAQLIEALRAAHVESYYDQGRLKAITDAVTDTEPSQSPMPRFRRVLDRAENAWKRKPYILRLPPPGKRDALEQHPGLLCRYVVTKTLYERAFPAWLESRSAKTLNCWIERATSRTTQEARAINKDELAVARAAKLIHLREEEDITHFFDRLSAATATEMRVQRGYDSDADKAREQAKYIDDLRFDVVGQAFEAFLKERSLEWVLDDLTDDLPKNKRSDLAAVSQPESASSRQPAKDWHVVLYFLLHLVPVDAVGRLQHQLRKWTILVRKGTIPEGEPSADVEAVQRLFGLYLDMHDAKFEGGEGMAGAEALKELFASEKVFSQVCSNQPDEDTDRYVPWRGLREILRFGSLEPLRPIFKQHRITEKDVEELTTTETPIAKRQKEREELHAKWVKEKRKFSDRDRAAYSKALDAVAEHRHLAAHVRLNNHTRLNGLLMQVLGRLADYACLWERDLYFTTLALIADKGKSPKDVFQEKALELLRNGRIVDAVKKLEESRDDDGKKIFGELQRLFGDKFHDGKNGTARDRNYLAHFNMLRDSNAPLDMTRSVNRTRRLVAYDRKLKNSVAQSIKEMLAREGFDLTWTMKDHVLRSARIKTRQAFHLGGKTIREDLHGTKFVSMTAALFAGMPLPSDGGDHPSDMHKTTRTQRHKNPKGGRTNDRTRRKSQGSGPRFLVGKAELLHSDGDLFRSVRGHSKM